MKLIEKFAEFTKQESWEKENYNAKECEQIADEVAIEFTYWLLTEKDETKTLREMLEIFKKEKGL